MGFDQKGAPVFCVTQGQGGQWHVSEEGFEKPLASFNSRNDAEEYARDLARTKEGSTVRTPDQGQSQGGQSQAGQSQGGESQGGQSQGGQSQGGQFQSQGRSESGPGGRLQ